VETLRHLVEVKPGNRPLQSISPQIAFQYHLFLRHYRCTERDVQSHARSLRILRMLAAYDYTPTSISLISNAGWYIEHHAAIGCPTLSVGGRWSLMKILRTRFVQLAAKHR